MGTAATNDRYTPLTASTLAGCDMVGVPRSGCDCGWSKGTVPMTT